jgi:hypothetical protein
VCGLRQPKKAPKNVIDEHGAFLNNRRTPTTPDFGVWVKGKQGSNIIRIMGYRQHHCLCH